MYFKKLIRRE